MSLLADLVVIVHLAFVLFVVIGGLLVLRWPRVAWLHLPAAAWGVIHRSPCVNCAKVLAAAGVRAVKYYCDYNNDPMVFDLLADAGVAVTRLPSTTAES